MLTGNILITGCGFLARAIMQEVGQAANFTVYSRNEHAQEACRRKFPNAQYVLGDVRDVDRLEIAMLRHNTVIHTAALKYVDKAEDNISECFDININGTIAVITAARRNGWVGNVIGISTDKAVEPSNTYGLSKAVGERLFWEASQKFDDISFVQTRYGNVIGSTGSVVPKFRHQATVNKKVTVTDPNMSRFWISYRDAVNLIKEASASESGVIVIPTPSAMSLGDLVEAVVPGVEVEVIGLRPGEKLSEKLMSEAESLKSTFGGRSGYFYYKPDRIPNVLMAPFELDSRKAKQMTIDEFRQHVAKAELI